MKTAMMRMTKKKDPLKLAKKVVKKAKQGVEVVDDVVRLADKLRKLLTVKKPGDED